uniref:Uncharacterized protein n=1 Tax=Arundo donax TaxID=35708 RepID=A0A0A9H7W3_ARUDO
MRGMNRRCACRRRPPLLLRLPKLTIRDMCCREHGSQRPDRALHHQSSLLESRDTGRPSWSPRRHRSRVPHPRRT